MLFDRAELLSNFDGDEELAESILEDAMTEIPKEVERLLSAFETADSHAIRLAAHTIKGMAANLCTHSLMEIALEIEAAAKEGDVEAARRLLPGLQQTTLLTIEAIR